MMWSRSVSDEMKAETACLGCLATGVKLYDIYASNLADSFVDIVGVPVPPAPRQLCTYCRAQLRSSAAFRARARRVQDALANRGGGKALSPEYIKDIGKQLKHPYCQSDITLVVLQTTDEPVLKEIKQETDSDSDDYFLSTLETNKEEVLSDNDLTDKDETDKEEFLPVFAEKAKKETKRKRVKLKNKIKTEKVIKERTPKKTKTDDEIKRDVNAFNFDVVFLTREEQVQEVTELKNRQIKYTKDDKKCQLCGKNFKTKRSREVHFKNYHDAKVGNLVCDICHCRFTARNRLNTHMKIHRERFHCRNCDFVTNRECGLRKHFEYHQGKKYTCQYCTKVFAKVSSYMSHVRLIHASLLPWCELCGESFIGEKGVQAHKKRAHKDIEDPQFDCDGCKTSFMNDKALEKHKSVNKCGLSSCVHCGDGFASLQLLKYHLVTRHGIAGEVTSDCHRCRVGFHSAAALQRHGSECGNGVPCVQCGESFDTAEVLATHEEQQHTALNLFKCEECGRTFTNANYFRDHASRGHERTRMPRDQTRKSSAGARRGAPSRPPSTALRTWRVLDERRLVMERADVSREPPVRHAVCEVCGKAFATISLLKLHQRLHTGEKLFSCSYCGKKFNISTQLRNHMRVHTGERPYKCSECPKAFKEWAGFQRHKLSHLGVRRHMCELCGKSFLTSTCVKVHIRSVHMKIPMPPRVRKPRVKHE